MGVGQQVRRAGAARGKPELRRAPSPAPEIFLWSRAAIWAAAIFAFLAFEPHHNPRYKVWDNPFFHDLGWATDIWARWDSGWFVRIAEHGYASHSGTAAFFPLYPGLMALLGRVFFGHYIVAGIAISLAASLGAFVLLHRLAEERLGAAGARRAVLYLAVFPMTLFLQAVYSEALFLVLVLAAFALAERGRFLPAWTVAGLALLTRSTGLALLPALAVLAWRARDRRRALAGAAIVPAVFAVYPLGLWWQIGDPWAFARAQDLWQRHLSYAGPLGGVWGGLRAAWAGFEQLAAGSTTRRYWPIDHSTPMHVAAVNLENLFFLVVFLVLTVVAWRRFGAPYGVFAAASVAIPLSLPSDRWPLLSIPRFGVVVFPFFLALAWLGGRPHVHSAILVVSSIMLGVAVVQWALWQWVS